jgi:hypothetical protein
MTVFFFSQPVFHHILQPGVEKNHQQGKRGDHQSPYNKHRAISDMTLRYIHTHFNNPLWIPTQETLGNP